MSDSRREFLGKCLLGGGMMLGGGAGFSAEEQKRELRQSVMGWCFNGRNVKPAELAAKCLEFGITGIEGIPAEAYPEVRKMGTEISLVSGGHGFKEGPCNPKFREKVVTGLRKGVALAKEVGSKRVITFTGMRFEGIDDEKAADDCVSAWKEVVGDAEKAGITIVMEHLNSRDDSHPMKGHPGYFGDDVDFCFDLVKRVGSENFKLLFDIYHVSVMNGDVIRRIRQNKELIGHYHTAGNPGRGELDENQEINYPAVIAEIKKTGFDGWIAHEFLPTYEDHFRGLKDAAEMVRGA
ncbi:MAG: TIM barrel protein [Akkermansiaceae bacterium]|nr:TIM barrel protein [Akkermansiaceae bacterium]